MKTMRTLFSRILDAPFIGTAVAIVNNYVAGGAFSADDRMAPLRLWLKFAVLNLALPAALTYLVLVKQCSWAWMLQGCDATKVINPGPLATSVLPSVLGFGIGVYALIFVLSSKFVRFYHEEAQKRDDNTESMTVLALNADMAFPLVVIAITLILGVLQSAFDTSFGLKVASWYFLLWSLFETLALIGVIYRLGEQSLLEKLPD